MTFSLSHIHTTQHACPIVAVRPRSLYARWRRTAPPCAVAFLTIPKKSKCPKPTPTSSSPAYSTIRSADAAWEKHASIPVASSVPPASHVGGPGVEASDTGAQGRVHGCALRLLWGRAGSGGAHSLPLRPPPPSAPLVYHMQADVQATSDRG